MQRDGVSENVRRERDRRCKRREVGAGYSRRAETRIKIFTLDRQVVAKAEFRASASYPSCPLVVQARAFMGCGKGISKQCGVLHVGQGSARGPIEQGRAKDNAHARARGHQPAGLRRLGNSESRGRAAWIERSGGCGAAQVHLAEVPFQAENNVAPLPVVACLTANGEAVGLDLLAAGGGDGRRAGCGEITGWAEDGTGIHVKTAKSPAGVRSDVESFKIVRGFCRAKTKQYKSKRTSSR